MDRNHSIIMHTIDNDPKGVRCFACIGRDYLDDLCSYGYLKDINPTYIFLCGVSGYSINASRHNNIEHFNNNIHKIVMSTSQCYLCDKHCKYPDILCERILETITKYKEVVGII